MDTAGGHSPGALAALPYLPNPTHSPDSRS
jgi:hypothetical protein